jgi:hypothetical protein
METKNRIKISSIVESQLPLFVREEYPLVSELLTEYYKSLESKGSSYDILQNIDQYVKVNNIANLVEKTHLSSDVGFADDIINVDSTKGFPQTYGLIQIDDEIILYKSKTDTSFVDCVRGFSGVTEYSVGNTEDLSFSSSEIQEHQKEIEIDGEIIRSEVKNISSLFLKEFFIKTKKQFLYGFDNRELYSENDQNLFLKQAKDFYTSKGTDRSFEIIFRVLYGKDVEVILPRQYLIEPSNSQYRITRNLVVESIQGNPELLVNNTIFQDEYNIIPKSFGTVTDVQTIIKNGKKYYTLFLDYDFDKDIGVSGSIFGDLKIHPKSVISSNVRIGDDNIIVDSTIGFPESGDLILGDQSNGIITYEGKTINQFLNCSGITNTIDSGTEISLNTYAYGYDSSGNEVRFRITGVISEANVPTNSKYYEKNDIVKILTLGYNKNYLTDNNWIFNKTVKCEVKSFTSDGEFKYTIETYDDNGVYDGDEVEVEYTNSITGNREISTYTADIPTGSIPGKVFQISTPGINISNIFNIKRNISRFSNRFASDILNVYRDFDSNDLYVTSSSLPSYKENEDLIEDYKVNLSGIFSGETLDIGINHGFITGNVVLYLPESENNTLGIQSGVYFVKKESDSEIKLARSRSSIRFEKFVSISSTSITNNTISLLKFSKKDNLPSEIDSQRVIKLLRSPENTGEKYETTHGTTGILINGVEILNYKSDDYLYYGAIKNVDVLSPGNNYDIISPPILEISPASQGLSTSFAICGLEGSLQRIDLIDGGFDYIDTPIINISGSGGNGATATAKMIDYEHYVDLNSSSTNQRIDLTLNQIGFSTYHRFRDNETVIYDPGNNVSIGGLTTEAKYHVKVIDGYNIKLHKTLSDSVAGINTINLTSYGSGNHRFKSTTIKKKISSIIVTNSGQDYKNKKILVPSSGINTSINTINVYENPYNSGDVIYYYGGDQNISGLDTGKYIVTRVNDESFKLSSIGIGSTAADFYYKTNQYINFKSNGDGNHIFNYEPIIVDIKGRIGISSILYDDVYAKVQPVFRGKISSVFVYDGGVGYGSSEIINYNPQPNHSFKIGSGAILSPIVSNGKIINVVIKERGKDYNSLPDIVVKGFGIGAVLSPVIVNGEIVDVKIINGGINYQQKSTIIDVIPSGVGCELKFNPQIWTINKFERLIRTSKIAPNDSVVYVGKNKNYGLEYTHLYAPRSLRKKIFARNIEEGSEKYKREYQNDFDIDKYHSPLIGWAYDGNPIYGPYGYDSPSNKKVRQITSGYLDPIDNQENRPSKKIFPAGYFVEDYKYNDVGDLDENNGRFCVTPEYPNGTYAYFMTLDTEISDSGTFVGDKKPKFPYIIGNYYKSKPIEYNLNYNNTQENFKFDKTGIIRNTRPYNTLSDNSIYEFFTQTKDLKSQDLLIRNTTKGTINSIQIISGGENYKVGDRVIFNNEGSGGSSAAAEVDYIKGREIVGISQTSTEVFDVEFYPSSGLNELVAFSTSPHGLSNGDYVFVDSLSNYDVTLQKPFNIGVNPSRFILTLDVGDASVTGLTTYFSITGILQYPNIRENDILTINAEKIKVLNVDKENSRIRVLREQDSTVSTSHSAYTLLVEDPRKFYFDIDSDLRGQNYQLNRELYFDPKESLGIGSYVGFGHTITFSNPGTGISTLIIPQKTVYLKNHKLNTGDEIKYKTNSGIGISVSIDGITDFELSDETNLYVAKISEDLIGISTVKVGIGTTGGFVGISQTASTLFFTHPGLGDYHSFQTKFDSLSKGNITKNIVTVSTASTHLLKENDLINLNVSSGLTTTIFIKYDDHNRKLVVNPRDFSFVDIDNNLITIENHKYEDGQKLIHTSSSPANGLVDQEIYYAIVYDRDRIRLARSYYGSINRDQSVINITSSSFGTLSQINPKINITRNQKVIIDLSDSSLSQPFGVSRTAAFDFDLFTDPNFTTKYFPIDSNGISKISKFGVIGVSSSSKIEFVIDDSFPSKIWYNLVPNLNLDLVQSKIEYVNDDEVDFNNQLSFTKSVLSGNKSIVGVTSNTFTFHNEIDYDSSTYTNDTASFGYYTNSQNEIGEIENVKIVSEGRGYERLPSISSVSSFTGSGAILLPNSETIGKINSTNIIDIGYNYSIDSTIKPTIKYPTILRVEPLTTLDFVKVISPGFNYNTSPDLIVIDGFTNRIVDDILLDYDISTSEVKIIKNTKGLYNSKPKVVSINNSNGLGISSIQYESSNKTVRAYLKKQFSNPTNFPFSIGDKVLIEGIAVLESSAKGYNSKNYNYSVFSVVGVNTSLGGSNAYIDYSLENQLSGSQIPGTFDLLNSSGKIIPERFLPSFDVSFSKNSFIVGEPVILNGNVEGKVLNFDKKNEFLTIETKSEFLVDATITGKSSKSQVIIKEIFANESFYNVDSSSIVENGWNRETGFLNNDLQRIQDSDYYQNFSYSLKSEVPIQEWNDIVNNLNHTLGFKKFSDLILNTAANNNLGISTFQNDGLFSSTCDLNSIVDVDCIQDYDLVYENSFYIDETLTSDEVIFNSVILQDYSESIGNRVLTVDDISDEFNTSVTRTFVTSFSI